MIYGLASVTFYNKRALYLSYSIIGFKLLEYNQKIYYFYHNINKAVYRTYII